MGEAFRQAGFAAVWHPELMLSAVVFAFVYLQVLGPLRDRFPGSGPVPWRRRAAFLVGLVLLYVAQGSPLALLANRYLFSAHVVQMVLLVFAAPPLLLTGTPAWLLRPAFRLSGLAAAVRYLTSPVRALALFVVVFSVYLLPPLVDSALGNNWLYLAEHTVTVGIALLMWWPVLSPVPEVPRLPDPLQMLYTFLIELGMTVPFALITFAGKPLYEAYAQAPRVLSISALTDQQIGGITMRLGSMLSFGVMLGQAFFRWAARDSGPSWRPEPAGDRR